jgi:tRNA A-37 threonylcarbamoyl transferase component Bud32
MLCDEGEWRQTRAEGLRIAHRVGLEPQLVLRAIARHRENVTQAREACEHCGPGSSVSRVVLEARQGTIDLAVKWNHWRGWRGALSDTLRGSRAARALEGARCLRATGLDHPESLAIAERRRLGLVRESFLLTRFLAGSEPLPAAMPALRAAPERRRALAYNLGDVIGRLHAGGLDHSDLKHSNLLVSSDGAIALLDLDSLIPQRAPIWRRRVRALGQLEAYATDLYPWLPRTDRLRFLASYLRRNPELAGRRRELVDAVAAWVRRRLAAWGRKDRSDHIRYPLAPRREAAEGGGDASPDASR